MKPENRGVSAEPVRVTRNGRRFFSAEHKQAVVERCLAPGASVSAVALTHGFNANLVRKWIAKHRGRRALPRAAAPLLPVRLIEGASSSARRPTGPAATRRCAALPGSIEIEIGPARVTVRGSVEAEQLRVVLAALADRR